MALAVTHSTVVAIPDDGSSLVSSDEWNAGHTITGSQVAGSDTQLQFNGTGAFAADANLTWNLSNDQLSIGNPTPVSIGGFTSRLNVAMDTDLFWTVGLSMFENNLGIGPTFTTAFSRHTTVGSHTIVQNADTLFTLNCYGSNGTEFKLAGSMSMLVSGSPQSAGNNIPSLWNWSTSPDVDGATPTNRMQLKNNGALCLSGDGIFTAQELGTGLFPKMQALVDAGVDRGLALLAFNDGDHGTDVNLGLSRSGTHGAHVTVINNDQVGSINFWGSNGTIWQRLVHIVAEVDGTLGTGIPGRLLFTTTPVGSADFVERARIDSKGNVVINTAAIATNATDGFLYVPTCAGTPTGTPTTYTGRVPIVVDTTNNKLYFYSGGAWRDAGP